ncbi:ADP-ribosylhydrolase ARH1-like [Mercenaria mercenaria]|uniref:ADP-ribosylhydrolase ARH1-like n=1 Tax=Mercenaria mercenaria TaxID=6596 RepID=UPI00234EF42D|nr:ADP-ribosylhydrolase ARH1-like [Mercenaria mercenaria]
MINLRKDRYIAGMVLSGVGDAIGYKNGKWEFCTNAESIHNELQDLGGLDGIDVKKPQWPVSDNTVMHLATAKALIRNKSNDTEDIILRLIASEYKKCMKDMSNRSPGNTCVRVLKDHGGLRIPFNTKGGGCGAAMRSMCIGLRYPDPEDIDKLIAVSIESGRLTHHHPTGYLGSLASALFTSYAVQNKPLEKWGVGLLSTLKKAKEYIEKKGICVQENIDNWGYFESKWHFYLGLRNILDGGSQPRFPPDYHQPKKRDQFYTFLSYVACGGASGHDAPMIAYDAILACNRSWKDLCYRAMLHGGDSDSTGAIAGCLYGVLYGFENVPEYNHKSIEKHTALESTAKLLFELAKGNQISDEYVNDEPENSSSLSCCAI